MNTRAATRYEPNFVDDDEDLEESRFTPGVERIIKSVQNFATFSEALRILGASVLLASMSVFLLQGWNEGNDISRYLLLLAQTGLLAAAGFAMSHGLKEAKGARMFFGLALVSIPANFTILGALLYSVFQWDGGLTSYPAYASWQIENVASTGLTLGGALLVLIPVTFFCFAVMARHSAKPLSMHFLLLNMLLLLPIRSSLAAGTVALLGVLYALYVVGQASTRDPALKTGEGKFALTALFIPLGIILFRSMYFYHVDSLMIAMVSLALFMAARQASMFPERSNKMAMLFELFSLPLAVVAAVSLTDASAVFLHKALQAPFFAVVYSVMALDLIRRTRSQVLTGLAGVSISLFIGLSFAFSVAVSPSAGTALFSLLAGTVLVTAGIAMRDVMALLSGLLTLAASAAFGLDALLLLIVTSGWIELAIFGASTIALASVLDRHGVAIKLRLVKWFKAAGEDRIALQD